MASRPPIPLTEQDKESMDTALAQLDEARQLMDLAQRAGIDVQVFRDREAQTREKLQRMRQVFFPNQ